MEVLPEVTAALRLTALLLSAALITIPAQAEPYPNRNVLWLALQGCIIAKKTADRSFPCLSVDLGGQDHPGTAVLRAPGQPTHTVVMPTTAVVGVEAPQLQQSAGNAYWRAALAARSYVTDALAGKLTVEGVGLAVNSVGGRSQDQLHIHLDCIEPAVRVALQRHSQRVHSTWAAFPVPLHGSRYFAKRIAASEVDSFNPFAALMQLPGHSADLRSTSFAAFSIQGSKLDKGFYLLAYRSPNAHAEKLLDHQCSNDLKAARRWSDVQTPAVRAIGGSTRVLRSNGRGKVPTITVRPARKHRNTSHRFELASQRNSEGDNDA